MNTNTKKTNQQKCSLPADLIVRYWIEPTALLGGWLCQAFWSVMRTITILALHHSFAVSHRSSMPSRFCEGLKFAIKGLTPGNLSYRSLPRLALSVSLMMPHLIPTTAAVWLLLVVPLRHAHASAPQILNYQGRLTDSNNNPLTGSFDMVFRICSNSACDGAQDPLWTETHNGGNQVTTTNGIYSVLLGSITPIPFDTFDSDTTYLEIQVSGETLLPRQRFASSSYALNSAALSGNSSDFYVSTSAASQTIEGVKTFTVFPVKSGGLTPTLDGEFVTKIYVDAFGGSAQLSSTSTWTALQTYTRALTVSNTNFLVIGGNIGIGTTGPSEHFHIRGADNQKALIDTTGNVTLVEHLTGAGNRWATGMIVNADRWSVFEDATNANEHLTVIAGGDVGIGTVAPAYTLHVFDGSNARIIGDAAGTRGGIDVTTTLVKLNAISNVPLTFLTNNTEKMRIKADGNVGIGTDSPVTVLEVFGDTRFGANANDYLNINNSGGTNNIVTFTSRSNQLSGGNPAFVFRPTLYGALGAYDIVHFQDKDGNEKASIDKDGTITTEGGTIQSNLDGSFTLTSSHVSGGAQPLFLFNSSQSNHPTVMSIQDGSSAIVTIQGSNNSGNVGIGTEGPRKKLEVIGDVRLGANANDYLTVSNSGGTNNIVTFTGRTNQLSGGNPAFVFRPTLYGSLGSYDIVHFQDKDGNEKASIESDGTLSVSGNAGIGTTAPDGRLHAHTSSAGSVTASASGDDLVVENSGDPGISLLGGTANVARIIFGDATDNDAGQIIYHLSSDYLAFNTNNSEQVRIISDGNVGIGSTGPTAKLDVVGTVKATSFDGPMSTSGDITSSGDLQISGTGPHYFSDGNTGFGTVNPSSRLEVAGGSVTIRNPYGLQIGTMVIVQQGSGNVGIGTEAPAQKLHLFALSGDIVQTIESDSNGVAAINLDGTKTADGLLARLTFWNAGDSVGSISIDRDGADDAGALTFDTQPNTGGNTERMRITSTGKVGIGTVAPSSKLDVVGGSITVRGSGAGLIVEQGNVGIGTTSPSADLHVVGVSSFTTSITVNGVEFASVPRGQVSFFNLSSCPSGWTELTAARGRAVVGLPGSGTLAGTAGTALTDQENRAVGQHTHTFTGDALGNHTHTARSQSGFVNNSDPEGNVLGDTSASFDYHTSAANVNMDSSAITSDSAGTPSGTNANSGSVAGTNAPYIQFLVCEKD